MMAQKIFDCKSLHEMLNPKHGVAIFTYGNGNFVVSAKGKKLKDTYLASNWEDLLPKNGVYIMFEKGEVGHNDDRIVRIGINDEQDDRLLKRVKSHYTGNSKSVFRKHVGEALSEKNGAPATKQQILEYIQNNISFVLIGVDDEEKRKPLETMLISTVAKCYECDASDNWLGRYASRPKIRNGKLWNVQGLNGNGVLPEAEQLIRDGMVMGCDLSKFMID